MMDNYCSPASSSSTQQVPNPSNIVPNIHITDTELPASIPEFSTVTPRRAALNNNFFAFTRRLFTRQPQFEPIGNSSDTSSSRTRARARCGTYPISRSESSASFNRALSSSDLNWQWERNYREAAIYLDEGLRNEKFELHPSDSRVLPYYFLAHTTVYNLVQLIASLVLLFLSIFEPPGSPFTFFGLPVPSIVRLSLFPYCVIFTEVRVRT